MTKKKRPKFIHEPSTLEVLYAISSMPDWCDVLTRARTSQTYVPFLKWLKVEKNFYKEKNERTTIKKIASDFGADSAKVTKWEKNIYNDLIELNQDEPSLFSSKGHKVSLYFRYFDSSAYLHAFLPFIPRVHEEITFHFIKAKVGIDYFWVERIEYEIKNAHTDITIVLQGGRVNRYRQFVLDRAIFEGKINSLNLYDKLNFEIDDELKALYRH